MCWWTLGSLGPAERLSEKALGCERVAYVHTYHRAVGENIGVVLIDKFLHPHLPQLEHLGASVGKQ